MKITVIGLGYVGAVAAAGLAAAGHQVLGVDIDAARIAQLQSGRGRLYEPGLAALAQSGIAAGRLRFRRRDAVAEDLGAAALIAVGTPQGAGGAADLRPARAAVAWVKEAAPAGLTVVMKSTVPPGTGQRILDDELRGRGLSYVSNPEFLREGRAVSDWQHPARIVIGCPPGDCRGRAAAEQLHQGIAAPRIVTDITSAEMIKYASNAFLATRISFINEIATLCEQTGASIDAVSEGLALDPRSGGRIYAGVGYGGSCFPKDVRALEQLAVTSGVNLDLLRSVINVNNRQRRLPLYALRRRFKGALAGVRVAVLGLAFKPGTDDVREAPSLDLVKALAEEGALVSAYDPQAMAAARRHLPESVRLADNAVDAAGQAQALALMTEWAELVAADWGEIARAMQPPRLVYDGRNALDAGAMERLGFEYAGVGRRGRDRAARKRRDG